MLTQLCAKREAQYAQQENELKRNREDLIKRGFVAQNQLNVNRNEYKNKLEAMTKVYKNVIDVRMIKFIPLYIQWRIFSIFYRW